MGHVALVDGRGSGRVRACDTGLTQHEESWGSSQGFGQDLHLVCLGGLLAFSSSPSSSLTLLALHFYLPICFFFLSLSPFPPDPSLPSFGIPL